jgi:hypothetical protein
MFTPTKTVGNLKQNFSLVYNFFEPKDATNKSQCKSCLKYVSGDTTSN